MFNCSDNEAKYLICKFGHRLYSKNLVVSNAGNISCRVSEEFIWATPTGICKGDLTEDMLLKLDLDGNVVNKSDFQPSSEIKMHLGIYKRDSSVGGVVHAHPIYASVCSIAGKDLTTPILIESLAFGPKIPVAKFAIPGTYEVPESVAEFVEDYSCALLANHGALTWGKSVEAAYFLMEALENYCQIYTIAKQIGELNPIETTKYEATLRRYGIDINRWKVLSKAN